MSRLNRLALANSALQQQQQTPAASSTPTSSSPHASSSSLFPQVSRTSSLGAENVVVCVRIRPLTTQERSYRQAEVWSTSEAQGKVALLPEYLDSNRKTAPEYYFDMVQSGSDNKGLYERAAQNVVWAAMEGMNGTVFAYGQTASGKTYSMMGVDDQPGVIPQAIDDVFSYIREQTEDREYLLRVSYLEIYNETVRDLLAPDVKDLRIHEDRKRGVYVSPLKEEIVTTPKQVMKVIQKGEMNRHFGTTDYNERSSRSHTIFQMIIESRDRNSGLITPPTTKRPGAPPSSGKVRGSVTISQLNLIDLAGSEKATSDAERRKEGSFINRSLLTLGNVISKLTETKDSQHIPYRDSKLTRILQSSLSGNARVSVIATISPAAFNLEETSNTLKFAERVKKVPIRAHQNQVLDERALIQKYKLEIAELRNKLVETNDLLEKERALQEGNLERAIRQQYEEQLHESQLVRTALKERIDHLTKLILSSSSVTNKAILDWNAPIEIGNNRVSVIMDGLLPSAAIANNENAPPENSRMSRMGRKSMRLSRQLSDKDFMRKQIAEIDKRDEKISKLESLVSMLKSSKDKQVQAIIASFYADADKAIRSTEELKEEVHKLRRQAEEMDIVISEQNEKLEMLEHGKGGVGGAPPVSFEDSPRYREMSFMISQQRQSIEDRDALVKVLKTQIQELRAQVRELELNEFEHLEQLAAAGINKRDSMSSKRSSLTSDAIVARLRELEASMDKERKERDAEALQATETISTLTSELANLRAELEMRDRRGSLFYNEDCVDIVLSESSLLEKKRGLVIQTHWDEVSDIDDDEYTDEYSDDEKPEKIPEGHVAVSFLDGSPPIIVAEDKFTLVDRAMAHGDIVKRRDLPVTSQSGSITKAQLKCDLKHVHSGRILEQIDSELIRYAMDVEEGSLVTINDWVGQVVELWDSVCMEFADGSICLPQDQNALEAADGVDDESHFALYRFYAGQKVRATDSRTLINGVWLRGSYNKNNNDTGFVRSISPFKAKVSWEFFNSLKTSVGSDPLPAPPEHLDMGFRVLRSHFETSSFQIGDPVCFEDLQYPSDALGIPRNEIDTVTGSMLAKSPHLFTFIIVKTYTFVDVHWQDGTTSHAIPSKELIPWMHVDDQDVWPTDYVLLKKENGTGESSTGEKVGVALSVDAKERVARVRWFDQNLEKLEGDTHEYSLYELVVHPDMQFRISDRVIVTESDGSTHVDDWFGEVLRVQDDGLVQVKSFLTDRSNSITPRRLLVVSQEFETGEETDDEDEEEEELWEDDKYLQESTYGRDKKAKTFVKQDNDEWVAEEADEEGWETDEEEEVPKSVVQSATYAKADSNESLVAYPHNTQSDVPMKDAGWETFLTIENAPISHHYYKEGQASYSREFHKRVAKEHMLLSKSLPSGILVRVFDDRIDLMRVLMTGPDNTPYDRALFMFDLMLPSDYPQTPPHVFFHSWTFGMGRLNPNLYEEGKVCLSLLGTWHGKASETWSPLSNVLQVLLSIQGLVLNRTPYYNEAGYERQMGTEEGAVNSALYSERTYLLVLRSVQHVITNPPPPFTEEVRHHFYQNGELRMILDRAQTIAERTEKSRNQEDESESDRLLKLADTQVGFPIVQVSYGGLKLLKSRINELNKLH